MAAYSDLISVFFVRAKKLLEQPVKMPGSLSPAIAIPTEDLLEIKRRFDTIASHCSQIHSLSTEHEKRKNWKELFGEPFPST
jgi:hypothetical protein